MLMKFGEKARKAAPFQHGPITSRSLLRANAIAFYSLFSSSLWSVGRSGNILMESDGESGPQQQANVSVPSEADPNSELKEIFYRESLKGRSQVW